jgi:hypothetical protein
MMDLLSTSRVTINNSELILPDGLNVVRPHILPTRLAAKLWKARSDPTVGDNPYKRVTELFAST